MMSLTFIIIAAILILFRRWLGLEGKRTMPIFIGILGDDYEVRFFIGMIKFNKMFLTPSPIGVIRGNLNFGA